MVDPRYRPRDAGGPSMHRRSTTVGLWITGLGLTAMFAAGTFNAVALVPNWYATRPDGIRLMRDFLAQGPTGPRTFFIPVALVTLGGVAVALGGLARDARKARILLTAALYVAVMILTLTVILPLDLQLFQGAGDPTDAELAATANRFVAYHVVRLALMAAGAAVALRAATARPPGPSVAPTPEGGRP